MTINIWLIEGYCGFDNYDGSEDNNFHIKVAIDSRFKKEDIQELIVAKTKKYRSVAFSITLVDTYKI